jgi:hypothetical protein
LKRSDATNDPMSKYSILNVSRFGSRVGRKGPFIRYKIYTEVPMKKTFIAVLYNDTQDQNKSTVNTIEKVKYPSNARQTQQYKDIGI